MPVVRPDAGGVYQYSEAMRSALEHAYHEMSEDLTALVYPETPPEALRHLRSKGWRVVELAAARERSRAFLRKILKRTQLYDRARRLVRRGRAKTTRSDAAVIDPVKRRQMETLGIDLLVFAKPDPLAFEAGTPSIMPIHDLQHRLQPEFPEVSAGGEYELREYLYRNAVRHCLLLLVDSAVGRKHVLDLYAEDGADPKRIRVVPFIPAPDLPAEVPPARVDAVRAAFNLPPRYFFYPANFWPHKNHLRLVEALAHEATQHLHVVLTGGRSGRFIEEHFRQVMKTVTTLGVEDRVHYLGFVSNEDLAALYAGATALVMPTFFGPTNIPVVEAWNLGVPVITSDVEGIREQVGDAGVLVEPRSVDAIARAMQAVDADAPLRKRLADAGKARLRLYTADDHRRTLQKILEDARAALAAPGTE